MTDTAQPHDAWPAFVLPWGEPRTVARQGDEFAFDLTDEPGTTWYLVTVAR